RDGGLRAGNRRLTTANPELPVPRLQSQARGEGAEVRIGTAAEQAGVNVQTLRYYERRGLLPRPPRRDSGYREFPDEPVGVVRFIKRAQDLGFALDDVEDLLRLRKETRRDRVRIRAIAERRVRQIDQKIAELQAMKTALGRLLRCCHEGSTLECPIIEALDGARGGSR